MLREIQGQAPARRAMWAYCADTSSDDGYHNTDNDALLLFGHAVVAPHLLSKLSALDELALALTCRFALDIFTVIQQDCPVGGFQASAYSTNGRARDRVAFPGKTIVKAPVT